MDSICENWNLFGFIEEVSQYDITLIICKYNVLAKPFNHVIDACDKNIMYMRIYIVQ